jgi:hypothetical protein
VSCPPCLQASPNMVNKKGKNRDSDSQCCALCGELNGTIRVKDSEGREVRICMRCNRLIDWH